jgi:hypothetical protein
MADHDGVDTSAFPIIPRAVRKRAEVAAATRYQALARILQDGGSHCLQPHGHCIQSAEGGPGHDAAWKMRHSPNNASKQEDVQ